MRIIVAGGRDFDDEEKFFNVMESELKEIRKHHDVIEIVSGHCSGADRAHRKNAVVPGGRRLCAGYGYVTYAVPSSA